MTQVKFTAQTVTNVERHGNQVLTNCCRNTRGTVTDERDGMVRVTWSDTCAGWLRQSDWWHVGTDVESVEDRENAS